MATSNLMSKAQSQVDVEGVVFYVVNLEWYRKAAPVLTYGTMSASGQPPLFAVTWKEDIGAIENASLCRIEDKKPAFLEEPLQAESPQGNSSPPQQLNGHRSSRTPTTTTSTSSSETEVAFDKQHAVHFVLAGSNVWLLLSQKFGYDVSLPARCVYAARTAWAPSVSVRVAAHCTVPLPPSGRFPYEHYLSPPPPRNDHNHSTTKAAADQVVSDDDDAGMDTTYDLVRAQKASRKERVSCLSLASSSRSCAR